MFKILRYTFNTEKLWSAISEINYLYIDYLRAVYFSAWGTLLITLTIKFSSYSKTEIAFILIAILMAIIGSVSCATMISKLKLFEQIYVDLKIKDTQKAFIKDYGYKQLFPHLEDYTGEDEKTRIRKQHRTHKYLLRGWYLPFVGIAFFLIASSFSFFKKMDNTNSLNETIIIQKIDTLHTNLLQEALHDSVTELEMESLSKEIHELKISIDSLNAAQNKKVKPKP